MNTGVRCIFFSSKECLLGGGFGSLELCVVVENGISQVSWSLAAAPPSTIIDSSFRIISQNKLPFGYGTYYSNKK